MTTAVPPLVSCEWLRERLDSGNHGDLVLIDVSWASKMDCHEEFKKQHIPGARYINVLAAEHTDIHPRNIPTPGAFTEAAQSAGVNADSNVIVYSNSDRAGYFLAGRGWWTFKLYGHENVSILDGGMPKWLKLGFSTTDQCPAVEKGNFVAKRSDTIYRSLGDVRKNIDTPAFQLLDTRADTAYEADHIPNAKNLALAELVDDDEGQLKSLDQLKQLFTERSVDLTSPLVTHCNSGMSSCSVAFVGSLLGAKDVAVFHGGFTEWTKTKTDS